MKKTHLVLHIIFLLLCANTWSQQKYWIYFNTQVENDTDRYVEVIKNHKIEPVVVSRWLQAVSALLNEEEKEALLKRPEVNSIQPVNQRLKILAATSVDSIRFGRALRQINAEVIVKSGLTGKGVKIGIIDGGFYKAQREVMLSGIINGEQVYGYRNYIERDVTDPYAGPGKNNDYHGTVVWKAIAGHHDKRMNGLAHNAVFYLARTDQADKEYRGEEDYWVAALEWMHSQGVRLVNSSVGYSNGYDNPEENYHPVDVDGESSAITRAARIASEEKGMLIVVSAGNDGHNQFRVISVPGDAPGVLTVGATNYYQWDKAGYSSVGPHKLSHIKPDVSCYASSGTSFSAPVITGIAACIMEANPELSNIEVADIIIRSAHLYDHPNNYIGYGVPDAKGVMALLNGNTSEKLSSVELKSDTDTIILNYSGENITAFHKLDYKTVLQQERLTAEDGKIIVMRKQSAIFTTVATPNKVWEIKWKE